MKFHEKLRRRVDELGLNKSKAAYDAGLPKSTISNYLIKFDSLPRIDIALKIAKALHVPLTWLADDSADWPPPKEIPAVPVDAIDDDVLMLETAKRCRRSTIRLLKALDSAEKIDWAAPFEKNSIAELAGIIMPIMHPAEMLSRFDPNFIAKKHHAQMPGGERSPEDFDSLMILQRLARFHSNPRFLGTADAIRSSIPTAALKKIEDDLIFRNRLVTMTPVVDAMVSGDLDAGAKAASNIESGIRKSKLQATNAVSTIPSASPPPAPPIANAPRDTLQGKQLASPKTTEEKKMAARRIVRKAKPIPEE